MSVFDKLDCPNCKLSLSVEDVEFPKDLETEFVQKTVVASVEENRINDSLKPTALHALRLLEEAGILAEKKGKKNIAARLARLRYFIVADLNSTKTVDEDVKKTNK